MASWRIVGLLSLVVIVFVGLCGFAYYVRIKAWTRKFLGNHRPSESSSNAPVVPEAVSLLRSSASAPTTDGSIRPQTSYLVLDNQVEVSNPDNSDQQLQSTSHLDTLHEDVRKLIHELQLENNIIAPSRLTIHGAQIGSGNGGVVHREVLQVSIARNRDCRIDVAVKRLGEDSLRSPSAIRKFLEECAVMLKLQHENVMRLEGVCLSNAAGPKLVLPFMPNGDLLRYVRNRPPLPVYAVLDFGIQISKGMRYLSSELPSQTIVHRDLAARNCMLDENARVVVTDFGLSRDVRSTGQLIYFSTNSQNMAFRWLAPECFECSAYSVKSDVWSFGVVIWELFTQGQAPYESEIGWSRNPEEALVRTARYIQNGGRLAKPNSCSTELYALVNSCWAFDPRTRPNFEKLVTNLSHMKNGQLFERDEHLSVPVDM